MKNLLDHTRMVLLALTFCLSGTVAWGQITITKADFNAKADEQYKYSYVNITGHTLPELGPGQTWDFSGYTVFKYATDHFEPSKEPSLPRAYRHLGSEGFLSFDVQAKFHYAYDSVYGIFASTMDRQAFGLKAMTSNSNDSLVLLKNNAPYAGGTVKEVAFPLTYNKTWSSDAIRNIDFELTMAAYGLNKTPGKQVQRRTRQDSVLGWGTVIIPRIGGGTVTKDVLVIRAHSKRVDSTFLGGAPAPPTLMTAFGLTQGEIEEYIEYRFYAKGSSQPIVYAWSYDGGKSLTSMTFKSFYDAMTITYDEYRIKADESRTSIGLDPSSVTIPQTGFDQSWDYSSVIPKDTSTETFTAANNPNMPKAFRKTNVNLTFLNFPIPTVEYYTYDQSNYGQIGESVQRIAYSIKGITGGANDSMIFPTQEHYYAPYVVNNIHFPLEYMDDYKMEFNRTFNGLLTVQAFGLSNAPVSRRQGHYTRDTVLGYGHLTLPVATGGTMTHEVLMIKTYHYHIDSFFLYGGPMPPALLNAFGLVQGDTAQVYQTIVFITENLKRTLFRVVLEADGTTVTGANYYAQNQERLAYLPTYKISDLRTNDAVGKPEIMEKKVRVSGLVNDFNHDGSRNWLNFAIQDGTDGIVVFNQNDTLGYKVTRGDSLEVFGDVAFFRGITQIIADSITVLSQNNPEDIPQAVTMLDESTEAGLVRINKLKLLDPAQWGTGVFGFNADVTNGNDTFNMRIENETDLLTAPAPKGWFDAIGIGWQYDLSAPYDDEYEFVPRSTADIIAVNFPQMAVINEFLADNKNADKDQAGEYDDWIELYNTSTSAIEMKGYYLSNDKSNTKMWEMPATALPAQGYLVIWADNDIGQSGIHAPFELQNIGEIYLSDPNGNIIDSVIYQAQRTDTSYARLPNGTGAFDFARPTAGAENEEWPNAISEHEQYQFSIYPTVLKGCGQVTLILSATHPGPINFSVTSTLGQVLIQEKLQMEKGKANYRFSIPGTWSAGVYPCHITTDSGKLIWYGKILVE